jgi:hypothetical protein
MAIITFLSSRPFIWHAFCLYCIKKNFESSLIKLINQGDQDMGKFVTRRIIKEQAQMKPFLKKNKKNSGIFSTYFQREDKYT